MSRSFTPLEGLQDLHGDPRAGLDRVRYVLRNAFAAHGYQLVQPPIFEDPEPFLERSGEDIRQRMYTFTDPSGVLLAARPELTIPTCRLFLSSLAEQPGSHRLCYDGLVFRYVQAEAGNYREFRQIGVEHFGGDDAAAADAEAISLAINSLAANGLPDVRVSVSDIRLLRSLFDHLDIEQRLHERLFAKIHGGESLETLVNPSSGAEVSEQSNIQPLEALLDKVGPEQLHDFVELILNLSGSSQVGSRGLDQVAARLVSKVQRITTEIPQPAIETLAEFLAIEGPLPAALDQLQQFAEAKNCPPLQAVVDEFRRRMDLIEACGCNPATLQLAPRMGRSLQYYTGFIFEMHCDRLGAASEVCGGGRYDSLLKSMGANGDIPAVGFAIGADRLQMAVTTPQLPAATTVIRRAPDVDVAECFRAARRLREIGCSASVDLAGRPAGDNYEFIVTIKSGDGLKETALHDVRNNREVTLPMEELLATVTDMMSRQGEETS